MCLSVGHICRNGRCGHRSCIGIARNVGEKGSTIIVENQERLLKLGVEVKQIGDRLEKLEGSRCVDECLCRLINVGFKVEGSRYVDECLCRLIIVGFKVV